MKIVIIGNGIAGNQVAFQVREKNRDDLITILSAESVPEYDPCSLPYFLGGEVDRQAVFRKTPQDYAKQQIELLTDHRVISIDPQENRVNCANGTGLDYDKLVLAHGGSLFMPPIEGLDKEGIFSCKQLAETDKLRAHRGQRAVVIGSGAIGIEAAEALKKRGYAVTIVELLQWIMPAMFDQASAQRLGAQLSDCGIQVLTSEKVLAVEGRGAVSTVVTDKRSIPCDTVVIATGVVPGVALAKTAGIQVDRGIQVDATMATNVADIYACGDCVETVDACTGENAMFQLKHNAIDQADIVAQNLLGVKAVYPGAYAFARIHFWDTHGVSFGKTTLSTQCQLGELEIIEKEQDRSYLRLILKEDVIVGGQALGTFADKAGLFFAAMRRQDRFSVSRKLAASSRPANAGYTWNHRYMAQLLA